MNHRSSSETQIALFSRQMAELVNRLRHFHVEKHSLELSWPVCFRLGVQADLLGGLALETSLEDLVSFSTVLAELATQGKEEPNQIPPAWSGALERLAEFLDQMMVGLDAGDSADQWLDDAQWERLKSWFSHLETPFLVMDELEEVLCQWQEKWCDDPLDSKTEKELRQRWIQLRQFGDALFNESSSEQDNSLLRWNDFTP